MPKRKSGGVSNHQSVRKRAKTSNKQIEPLCEEAKAGFHTYKMEEHIHCKKTNKKFEAFMKLWDVNQYHTHGVRCNTCNIVRPLYYFKIDPTHISGLRSKCNFCDHERRTYNRMGERHNGKHRHKCKEALVSEDAFHRLYTELITKPCYVDPTFFFNSHDIDKWPSPERFDSIGGTYSDFNICLVGKHCNFGNNAGLMHTDEICKLLFSYDIYEPYQDPPKKQKKYKGGYVKGSNPPLFICGYCGDCKAPDKMCKAKGQKFGVLHSRCLECVNTLYGNDKIGFIKMALAHAKHCAKRRGKIDMKKKTRCEFTITKDDILLLLKNQGERCAITGKYFSFKKNDWRGMSIDRIDDSKGYTPDNIRLIISTLNTGHGMKWTKEYYEKVRKIRHELGK